MAGCALLVLGLGDLDDAAVVPAALRCIWQNLAIKPPIIQEHNLYTKQVEPGIGPARANGIRYLF